MSREQLEGLIRQRVMTHSAQHSVSIVDSEGLVSSIADAIEGFIEASDDSRRAVRVDAPGTRRAARAGELIHELEAARDEGFYRSHLPCAE